MLSNITMNFKSKKKYKMQNKIKTNDSNFPDIDPQVN